MPYNPESHGARRIVGPGFHDQVYRVVALVPSGWVATYGDIAGAIGRRGVARQVGFALAALRGERPDVPWHRIVNAQGRVSPRSSGEGQRGQAELLREEGIVVNDKDGIVNFAERRFVIPPVTFSD